MPVLSPSISSSFLFFFFNDTATTEIYTLSLHDALPISIGPSGRPSITALFVAASVAASCAQWRSEEHTSELQSHGKLVCRLLLEKKKPPAPRPGAGRVAPVVVRPPARRPGL